MSIVQQALDAGFTHVATLGGLVPVEQFHLRDALGMTFDAKAQAIFGPWRPATTMEVYAYEARGGRPMIGLQGRDVWHLTTPIFSSPTCRGAA